MASVFFVSLLLLRLECLLWLFCISVHPASYAMSRVARSLVLLTVQTVAQDLFLDTSLSAPVRLDHLWSSVAVEGTVDIDALEMWLGKFYANNDIDADVAKNAKTIFRRWDRDSDGRIGKMELSTSVSGHRNNLNVTNQCSECPKCHCSCQSTCCQIGTACLCPCKGDCQSDCCTYDCQ